MATALAWAAVSTAPALAVLIDTFDPPNAAVTATQANQPPPAAVTAGGPTGQFLRLITDGVNNQRNHYSYDRTDAGEFSTISAQFDFAGFSADQPADGLAVLWVPTSIYGTTGVGPDSYQDPSFAGTFGLGFHTYPGGTNNVSLHWDGAKLATGDVPIASASFRNGVFNRVNVDIQRVDDVGSTVKVDLIGDIHGSPAAPVTALDTYVYGLLPYESRMQFSGRSGGANMTIDLDNIDVQYSDPYTPPTPISPNTLFQDFDTLGATPFTFRQGVSPPAPAVMRGGPTDNYARLTYDSGNSRNEMTFDRAVDGGVSNSNKLTFDFRADSPSPANPADGFSVLFLPTATYGDSGTGVDPASFLGETPNVADVLGVGFNVNSGGGQGSISLHYDGSTVVSGVVPVGFNLVDAVFHRAEVEMQHVAGGSEVTLTITPDVHGTPGTPFVAFDHQFVPGLVPYDYRVEYAGRTGGRYHNLDLDNIQSGVAPAPSGTDTVQDFDGGGSQYKAYTYYGSRHASLESGTTGDALRLLHSVNSESNGVAFDRSAAGRYRTVEADWDFSILAGADGGAFGLINTADYGTTGQGPYLSEEPNVPGMFAIGFDVYSNIHDISLHWDNAQKAQVGTYDFRGAGMKHAHAVIDYVVGGANVSLDIDGNPIFVDQFIAGMVPYEGRVGFGGRTGGVNTTFDLDNINVQFQNALPGGPFTWIAANDNYTNGAGWEGGAVPTGNDDAVIPLGVCNSSDLNVAGTGSLTVSDIGTLNNGGVLRVGAGGTAGTLNQTGGVVQTSTDLYVGDAGSHGSSYNMTGGTLTVGGAHTVVGRGGRGAFSQGPGTTVDLQRLFISEFGGSAGSSWTMDGGTLNINTTLPQTPYGMEVGRTESGTFTLNDGTLNIKNGQTLAVGVNGEGTFEQNGGAVYASGEVRIGVNAKGTYTMTDGTLTTAGGRALRMAPSGGSGDATFTQSGGTVTVGGRFEMTDTTTGTSTYNLSGNAVLNANGDYAIIGRQGPGHFVQSGTSVFNVDVDNRFLLADVGGSAGSTYDISGGELNVLGGKEMSIGKSGLGTFTQTGGTVTASGNLRLGEGSNAGIYNLQGGVLDVTTLLRGSAGQFNMTGGILQADNVQFALTNDGGTIAPGGSPGVTDIVGGYTQTAAGTYAIDIGGFAQGVDYDLIDVTGAASVDGTLAVTLLGGFLPHTGDFFDVLVASAGVTLGDNLTVAPTSGLSPANYFVASVFNDNTLRLTLAVPEPTTVLLLGIGSLGLAGVALRRRRRA